MDLLGDLAFREVFTSDAIYKMEVAEGAMLDFLLDMFIGAVVEYDDGSEGMDSLGRRMAAFTRATPPIIWKSWRRGKISATP